MRKKPVGPPPSTTKGDVAEGLARAALSAVPGFGGPAAELLTLVIDPALHRRFHGWWERVGEAVDDWQQHGLDIRTLEMNEAFITVVLNATAAAAKTHEEDKLVALRNAITNAALGVEPDEHVQIMFIRFVDEFQPLHLRMLALFRDPRRFFDEHGIALPTDGGSREVLIRHAIPEVRDRREIYLQAGNDLATRGLMNGAITGMLSDMWGSITTGLGNRFLDFIGKPK